MFSLYLQPFIGLLIFCKVLQINTNFYKITKIVSGIITTIFFLFVLIVPDIGILMNSMVIFHLFAIICIFIIIIQAFESLIKKNYDLLYALIGLFIFSAFALFSTLDNWNFINPNKPSLYFYTFGFFLFDFLLGAYLSRKFVKVNLNLLELTKTLENKVEERTKKIEELSKQRTDFFTNISHELRTPLTLILGPVEEMISGKYGNSI